MTRIGVPYARQEIKGRQLYAVCPVCSQWIIEKARKDFESASGSEYARHYIEQHEAESDGEAERYDSIEGVRPPGERITEHNEAGDWLVCICGNEPHLDGFYPSDRNGRYLEPLIGSDWDNVSTCYACGRVIDNGSWLVIDKASPAILAAAVEAI